MYLPEGLQDRILFLVASLPGAQEKLVLAKFLAGSHDAAMDPTGLPEREGFGALRGNTLPALLAVLDEMQEAGWFVVDVVPDKKAHKLHRFKLSDRSRNRIAEVYAQRLRAALEHPGGDLAAIYTSTPDKVARAVLEALTPQQVRALSQRMLALVPATSGKYQEILVGVLRRAGVT